MSMPALRLVLATSLVALAGTSPLFAVNRFFINNQSVNVGSTGNIVPIRADVDQDTFGFSIHLQYDATKVRVTAVELGSATMAIAPEYSQGLLSMPPAPGQVVHGVVFDTSGPTITKKLSPGTNLEVLRLVVDVLAAAPGTTSLNLVNVPGTPSRLNVMANSNGDSVTPAPTLVDGTLTFTSTTTPPVITSFVGNTGSAGKQFIIAGTNFNAPGLAVKVCDVTVAHTLLPGDSVQVNAPACSVTGWAEVEVCTNAGCDSEANGFFYEEVVGGVFRRGDTDSTGAIDITDGVFVLNYLFLGGLTPTCLDAADTDDTGAIDITDGVFILSYQFLGGLPPPAPGPDVCGPDPTTDDPWTDCDDPSC